MSFVLITIVFAKISCIPFFLKRIGTNPNPKDKRKITSSKTLGKALLNKITKIIPKIKPGKITPDSMFSLEVVQCLASCGTSPAVRVNDELYDDLNFSKVDRLLDQLAEREEA